MPDPIGDIKTNFSRDLTAALKRAYGGRLPSLSTVARDLALRSPHLPHVSTETVRKWIRGAAIPQSPRMQALSQWLGEDITKSLQQASNGAVCKVEPHLTGYDIANKEMAITLFEQLNTDDQILIINIIQSLLSRTERQSFQTIPNGGLKHTTAKYEAINSRT